MHFGTARASSLAGNKRDGNVSTGGIIPKHPKLSFVVRISGRRWGTGGHCRQRASWICADSLGAAPFRLPAASAGSWGHAAL